MDWNSILPLASLALGSYAALSQLFVSKANARRDTDIALLQRQSDLFWKMVEQHMTTVLHSPHTPDMDVLLERLQGEGAQDLTVEEARELKDGLLEVINNPDESQGNRAGAVFLLAAVEQRVSEEDPTN